MSKKPTRRALFRLRYRLALAWGYQNSAISPLPGLEVEEALGLDLRIMHFMGISAELRFISGIPLKQPRNGSS